MNFIHYGKQTVENEDIQCVIETLQSDYITTGPKSKEFEADIAQYCGAKYCVVVSSGTAALHLSSLALLKDGDKVLTTPNSFLATSNSILYANARPIFVDITTYGNIDLDLCEKELQKDPSIKAIYVVAFSGNMVIQEKLEKLRKKYNIIILEDCAHALGATYNGIKAGSSQNSDCSIFSFHPVKHITTGEGGAITTNSKEIYEKLIKLRNHGMVKTKNMKPWEYEIHELGFNYRLTDFQSALGISQLKKLPLFIKKRNLIAKYYDEAFKNTIIKPLYPYNPNSTYHLYVVQVNFAKLSISKEEFFNKLHDNKISIQLHYIPINKQPYYKQLGYGEEITPNMDKYYNESFSIPIYPLLTREQQKYVIKTLFELLNEN